MLHILKTTTLTASLLFVSLQANAAAVATVNGKEISQDMYQTYVKQLQARQKKGQKSEINRERLINELVNRELLHQTALKMKLEKDPQVKFLLKQQRIDLLTKAAMKKIVDKSPITEGEIEDTYKNMLEKSSPMEFKARHILLKTEDDAKAVIKKLNKGADFAALAKEKSTGPSAKSGGDLGWFKPAQMVPEFSKAAMAMKKGEHSKAAVKTQFGYHVIKLEDSRKLEAPELAKVKDQIRGLLQQQRIQKYVAEQRKKAEIKIK